MKQFTFVRGSIQGPGELFWEFEVRILIKCSETVTKFDQMSSKQMLAKICFCEKKAPCGVLPQRSTLSFMICKFGDKVFTKIEKNVDRNKFEVRSSNLNVQ